MTAFAIAAFTASFVSLTIGAASFVDGSGFRIDMRRGPRRRKTERPGGRRRDDARLA